MSRPCGSKALPNWAVLLRRPDFALLLRRADQAKEPVASRRDRNRIGTVAHTDGIRVRIHTHPIRISQCRVHLQHKPRRRRRPRDGHLIGRGLENGQQRRTRRLHHGENAPETASQSVAAARERARGRLADRAAQTINAIRTRAATARDGVPGNIVGLRASVRSQQQTGQNEEGRIELFHGSGKLNLLGGIGKLGIGQINRIKPL